MTGPAGAGDVGSPFLQEVLRESGLLGEYDSIEPGRLGGHLARHYGLEGRLERLATEKDDTFRLRTGEGDFLVKVSSPLERLDDVDLQVSALLHLERSAPELPVQRVQRTRDGAATVRLGGSDDGSPRILRVMRFVPGIMLADADPDDAGLAAAGRALARVDRALRDFEHPRLERTLVWRLSLFHRLSDLVECVDDPRQRGMANQVFELFRTNVAPRLGDLDAQAIHGDFSSYNVIVDPAAPEYVIGVIDFGDCLRAPIIFDPAVALANLVGIDAADPWAHATAFLAGYRGERPLPADEAALLVEASLARLTLRAVMAAWSARRSPERRDYVLEHARDDWARLEATLAAGVEAGRGAIDATRSSEAARESGA